MSRKRPPDSPVWPTTAPRATPDDVIHCIRRLTARFVGQGDAPTQAWCYAMAIGIVAYVARHDMPPDVLGRKTLDVAKILRDCVTTPAELEADE